LPDADSATGTELGNRSSRCQESAARLQGARWVRRERSSAFAPGAEDKTANCHAQQGPPRVDANEGPGVCFERGEHRNGSVFHKYKGEPARERDFQTAPDACRIDPRNEHCQRVVDRDRSKKREHIGTDVMRVFDVGHRARMKIQPFLAKNCVPTPANQKINDDEDPNGEMIDFRVHKVRRIIRASKVRLQENSGAARPSSILTPPLFLGWRSRIP